MKDYILFIVAMLIFGSNGVFASMLDMSGAQLVLMRTLIGGAVLLIIILIARSRTPREVLLREKWRLLFSGVCLGANWVLLFEAYRLMNVSLATLTYYTAPVMVLVLAPFVLGEKQNGRAYLGMAVVALGMLLRSLGLEPYLLRDNHSGGHTASLRVCDKRRRTAAQGRTRHFCTALSLHREHGLRLLALFQSYESAAGQGGGVARLF